MADYVGARWQKCDFHLHTTASKCFRDKSVTPQMWVQACLEKKLDCVAVTDHNTNAGIDEIKQAAELLPGEVLTSSLTLRCQSGYLPSGEYPLTDKVND